MRNLILIFFSSVFLKSYPQCINLVPNSSFESYTVCPSAVSGFSQMEKAVPWKSVGGTTSDYYHPCAGSSYSSGSYGVPLNARGNQNPKSGEAYAGFYTYFNGYDYYEYIQVKLLQPLETGKNYHVQFSVNLAEESLWGIDRIGILFTTSPQQVNSGNTGIVANPQIASTSGFFITNQTDWVTVSGFFTANDAFEYITIGNFNTVANTNKIAVDGPGPAPPNSSIKFAYYYIDDVIVASAEQLFENDTIKLCDQDTTIALQNTGSFEWTELGNPSVILSTDSFFIITPSDKTYILTVSSYTCSATDTIVVIKESIKLNAIASAPSICLGQDVILSVTGASSYRWYNMSDTNVALSTSDIFTVQPDQTTVYVVKDTTIGCSIEDTVSVEVVLCFSSGLYYPNTFTPDGNGINDVFSLSGAEISSVSASIYDRWGNHLYTWNNMEGGWDGKLNGADVPQDVYVLFIDYLTNDKINYKKIDKIILIR